MVEFMQRVGYFIGSNPLRLLLTTVMITVPILSFFILYPIVIETDVRRGFANQKGASTREFELFGEFYNISMHDLEILIVIMESKDGGKTPMKITPQLCDEVERLDKYISSLSLQTENFGTIHYKDFETTRGNVNFLFHAFKWAYDVQNSYLPSGNDSSIVLSYPKAHVYGNEVFLGGHFVGAHLNHNFRNEGLPTALEAVDAIALFYLTKAHGYVEKRRLKEWEMNLLRQSQQSNFSSLFDFYLYGDQMANGEMERGSARAIYLLAVGIILMILYMAYAWRKITLKNKILLIISAIASPILAALTSFAMVGWLGIPYNSIMSLTPVLVLGIGVDDAFLLLHSWRRNQEETCVAMRMSNVIGEIGPSISITSITNVLAFGVGIFSPAPMMSTFCLCTALAVGVDFIFQLAIFTPVLVISSRWEDSECRLASRDNLFMRNKELSIWWRYTEFVVSNRGRCTLLVVLISLYLIAALGIQRMNATFDPSKTFPYDSPLVDSLRLVNSVYKQYAPINFIVNRPPNISDSNDYECFMKMVEKLESLPESYGQERTLLWLRDYDKYYRTAMNIPLNATVFDGLLTYEFVPDFLDSKLMADKNIVRFHYDQSNSVVVDSFAFVVVCRGEQGWHKRAYLTDEIRHLLATHSSFNTSLFNYDATIFDLISTVKVEMAKAVLITLVCMMCVCFVFIPKILSTLIATLSILSISFSLLGLLSWWGLDMDPITMVSILMAIGFSVDFSAHICYHFYNYKCHDVQVSYCDDERVVKLASIFHSIGKPAIEAAISTVICVVPLFAIHVYTITSFAKTVCLVASLGILHGLFILPALLTVGMRKSGAYKRTPSQRPIIISNLTQNSVQAEQPMI